MGYSPHDAIQFVETLDLPQPSDRNSRKVIRPEFHSPDSSPSTEVAEAITAFDDARNQTAIVASDIIAFGKGITVAQREYVSDCALLAQLAARRKVSDPKDIIGWYEVFFDVLGHVGWTLQEKTFATYQHQGSDFEAHKTVLSIAKNLVGDGASYELLKSTVAALSEITNGSWMKIFKRTSQSTRAARFQVTLVEPGVGDQMLVSLMAFELTAVVDLVQVMFLRLGVDEVTLRHSSGKVTIDAELAAAVAPAVRKRVVDHIQGYVSVLSI